MKPPPLSKFPIFHGTPRIDWLAGDSSFWEDTAYEDLCLTQEGEFVPQYGQHTVEYAGPGEEDGVYYLRMFNNNYWSLNTRDYEPELDESVGTGLYQSGNEVSQVYVYRIDENSRSFRLEIPLRFPTPALFPAPRLRKMRITGL